MPLGGGRIKPTRTVWTLHIVRILGRRRWRQIGQLAAACQMHLHLFGAANGRNEFGVLTAPVAALRRRRCGRVQFGHGRSRDDRCTALFGRRHGDALRAQLLLHKRFGVGAANAMRRGVEDLALLGGRFAADGLVLVQAVNVEVTTAAAARGHVVAGRFGGRETFGWWRGRCDRCGWFVGGSMRVGLHGGWKTYTHVRRRLNEEMAETNRVDLFLCAYVCHLRARTTRLATGSIRCWG